MAYLLLCRVWNALFASAVCVYSFFIVKNDYEINYCDVVFLSLGVLFLVAFANVHNDIVDFEIDKINRPKRPLPGGKIGFKGAYVFLYASVFFTMLFGILAGIKFAFLFFIAILLCIAYDRFLKSLPLVGNFTVALLTTIPLLIPIINFGLPQPELSTLVFFAFILTFAREITKDIEDMEGDKSQNLKTLPLLVGIKTSLILVFISLLQCLMQIALFKPFLLAGVAPFFLFFAIFAVLKKWRLAQNMLKLAMLGGLATFLTL